MSVALSIHYYIPDCIDTVELLELGAVQVHITHIQYHLCMLLSCFIVCDSTHQRIYFMYNALYYIHTCTVLQNGKLINKRLLLVPIKSCNQFSYPYLNGIPSNHPLLHYYIVFILFSVGQPFTGLQFYAATVSAMALVVH